MSLYTVFAESVCLENINLRPGKIIISLNLGLVFDFHSYRQSTVYRVPDLEHTTNVVKSASLHQLQL